MDIVQRCLTWEAREPDVYVNFFYGFGFMDAIDAGMCFQVVTNGNPELAEHIADDIAGTAWRLRDEFLHHTKVVHHAEGVRLAKHGHEGGQGGVGRPQRPHQVPPRGYCNKSSTSNSATR